MHDIQQIKLLTLWSTLEPDPCHNPDLSVFLNPHCPEDSLRKESSTCRRVDVNFIIDNNSVDPHLNIILFTHNQRIWTRTLEESQFNPQRRFLSHFSEPEYILESHSFGFRRRNYSVFVDNSFIVGRVGGKSIQTF